MKLSNQAIGAIMMALQKSLVQQSDIVPILKGLKLVQMDNGELLIENPPQFKAMGTGYKEISKEDEVILNYGGD